MGFTNPTVQDFKNYFFRDFPYGTTLDTVQDQDVSNALNDAGVNFSQSLFSYQNQYTNGYLQLAAHYLCSNLQASSQGIAGQYGWLQNTKSVGNTSEGMTIPQRILDNPQLALYAKTRYGVKYLSYIIPKLSGAMFSVCGRTNP